jgi:hypothetical protein
LTCIAALVARGRVWMGGDAAVNIESEDLVLRQAAPKVFRLGPLLVGACGACSYEDAWRRAKPRPRPTDPAKWDEWITGEVFEAVKRTYLATGAASSEADESAALLGLGARLYYADGLTVPWRMLDRYATQGSSGAHATGVLRAIGGARMKALKLSPRDVILEALGCAALHSDGVREPFTVLST